MNKLGKSLCKPMCKLFRTIKHGLEAKAVDEDLSYLQDSPPILMDWVVHGDITVARWELACKE